MVLLTRSRCLIVAVVLSHTIILTAVITSLCVYNISYGNQIRQDMYTDMRLLSLGRSSAFCQSMTISTYPEQVNASRYQSLALFDAYAFSADDRSKLNRTFRNSTVKGRNTLLGEGQDYYSFHWLDGTSVKASFTSEKARNASVIVIQGDMYFDAIRKRAVWESAEVCKKTTCLLNIPIIGEITIDLLINVTDNYYVLFTADLPQLHNSKKPQTNDINENDPNNNNSSSSTTTTNNYNNGNSSSGISNKNKKSSSTTTTDVTIQYTFSLNQSVYETNEPWIHQKVTGQSELYTEKANEYFILNFNHKTASKIDSPERDFSNSIVKLECSGNILTYIGVFGLTALALIFITVLVTCFFLSRRHGDGDELVHTGDFTERLIR